MVSSRLNFEIHQFPCHKFLSLSKIILQSYRACCRKIVYKPKFLNNSPIETISELHIIFLYAIVEAFDARARASKILIGQIFWNKFQPNVTLHQFYVTIYRRRFVCLTKNTFTHATSSIFRCKINSNSISWNFTIAFQLFRRPWWWFNRNAREVNIYTGSLILINIFSLQKLF